MGRRFLLMLWMLGLLGNDNLHLPGQTAPPADFPTWQLGPDQPVPALNLLDMDPALIQEGKDLWLVYCPSDGVARLKGTTMDDLQVQPNGRLDESFKRPYGDDRFWVAGIWRDPDSGAWYATVHIEFNYGKEKAWEWGGLWFRRLGLAVSRDQGATWTYRGDIITSDQPVKHEAYQDQRYIHIGCGDQKLFVDHRSGYFYVYYMIAWQRKTDAFRFQSMRVARAPIKSKMAPGSWQKWYQGQWAEPGLGGRDSDVFMNADNVVVFFNTYLKQYVAIGMKDDSFSKQERYLAEGFIAFATDLSVQNWTPQRKFCDAKRIMFYNFPVDSETLRERMEVGRSFRLYSSSMNWNGLGTKYMTVTFGEGTPSTLQFQPVYPPEPVNDANPAWRKARNGTAK